MVLFNKKGSVENDFFNKIMQLLIPFIFFVIILGIILSLGSNRSAQLLFESTELANVIDASATFNGNLVVKHSTIIGDNNDFKFSFSKQQVNSSVRLSDAKPISRSLHIPRDMKLDAQLTQPKTMQIQLFKSNNLIQLKDWKADVLSLSLFRLETQTCAPYTFFGKVYLDVGANSDLKSTFLLEGLPLTNNRDEAALVIELSAIQSRVIGQPSVLVFADEDQLSRNIACHFVNQFSTISMDSIKIPATNVPLAYNPYSNKDCGANTGIMCKPTIVVNLATDGSMSGSNSNSQFVADPGVLTFVAKRLKKTLVEVNP